MAESNRQHQIALYHTTGNRKKDHCLVLYLGAFTDWSARQKERNGNKDKPLVVAPHTVMVDAFRASKYRVWSLRYNGQHPQNAVGLYEDLIWFGYSPEVCKEFLEKAKPYWPDVG